MAFAAAIAAAVLALPALGAGEAASAGNFAYAASHPETPWQTDGNSSATTADDSSSGFHIAPTLKGGATASISGIDPNLGFAFAIDGYYTPYGDSDPIFTYYGGLRWRFLYPIYLFAEYRYDADAKIDVGGDEETELEGGGRFLFGGGFMF